MRRRNESYNRAWGQLRGQGVPGSRIRVGRCSLCQKGWMWDRRTFNTHVDDDGGIKIQLPQSDSRPHQADLGPLVAHYACPECHGQRDMGSWTAQLRRTTRLANINWMPYQEETA